MWKSNDEYKSQIGIGITEILTELLKNLGEDMHNLLYKIITKSFKTGEITEEFVKCRTIILPKKIRIMECNNYRTISLLSPHT